MPDRSPMVSEVNDFEKNIKQMAVGMTGYSDNDKLYLYNVAKICFRQSGIPLAGVGGLAGATAGSIFVPGIGAVPGWLVGALAGAKGGTASCVISKMGMKSALDQLLNSKNSSD